jgi:SAM-dependent methyltransferase
MKIRPLLSGMASYLPFWERLRPPTGGTDSARYCYSVWLRHLTIASQHGLSTRFSTFAELGPGNSLGTGLAGLLSGADKYYALDIVPFTTSEENVRVLGELVSLFEQRPDIPDEQEFPRVRPNLGSYKFPHALLPGSRLEKSLSPDRIRAIKEALVHIERAPVPENPIQIWYLVPWDESTIVADGSVDMIFSQAVLEFVAHPKDVYAIFYRWLRPGGWMSHQIDFGCHGSAAKWNGHWAYSDLTWKIIKGRKKIFPNRLPHSAHLDLQKETGFEIVADIPVEDRTGITRTQLAPRLRRLPEDDLTISTAHIVSVKPK